MAEATHALHEASVIHRDIKPGNIMVSFDGSHAVLMDLGLAQLADEIDGKLTRTRQFIGTLRYASPEQVLAVDRLDRRSDIYSLGATLWELLTLRPLYGASEQVPTPEIMKRIQYADPGQPRKENPRISADLEAIVLQCLEKDSDRRYASAAALAQDLGRFLEGVPVKARSTGPLVRGLRRVRRHKSMTALVAANLTLAAAVIALLVFAPKSLRDRPAVPTVARAARRARPRI